MTKIMDTEVLEKRMITETKAQSLSKKMKNIDQDSAKLIEVLLNPRKTYHKKLEYIKHELTESVRDIEFNYNIPGFLEDTCYAIHRSISSLHGFTKMEDNKSASKDEPPTMLDVRFADGKRIKVPYGKINLPSFGPNSYVNMGYDFNNKVLRIGGVCQKKYAVLMDEIIETATTIVDTDSIYKNQAIKFNGNKKSPTFMDLKNVMKIKLFLTDEAKYATEPIELRISSPEKCIQHGLDLKFGVLLEGNYGTGKTLYASKLALRAIQNNWTFIYCANPQDTLDVLKVANEFSKNGNGVVLFIEDIDQVLKIRQDATNEISLLMDGNETKHNNLISIFSTNHIEDIDPTFMRGKRIGSIVTLTYLDAMTAEEMIVYSLGDTLKGRCNKAAEEVEKLKIVPAFLQEIIDRVKTHSILRDEQVVSEKDIINAIKQFQRQMEIATVTINTESNQQTMFRLQNENFSNLATKAVGDNKIIQLMEVYLEEQYNYNVEDNL